MEIMRLSSRVPADFGFEVKCRQSGYRVIAGLDEAGRGCLAGPVVAAAVILPENPLPIHIYDSKLLSPKQRESCARLIEKESVAFGLGVVSNEDIDQINILEATRLAMKIAVENLSIPPEYLLVDGNILVPLSIPQQPVPQGDRLSCSIAAASIIAKVMRDDLMLAYHDEYPQYNFARHKGYGTSEHMAALKIHGPCPIHRKTFRGV